MTEPATARQEDDEHPWRRLHPLSPLLRGGLALLVIGGILLANFRDRILELFLSEQYIASMGPDEGDFIDMLVEQRLIVIALLVALAIIGLIVFFSWLSWRFHTYRVTDEAVESRSGVLFRQHRRAPLERIQSVNLQRPLLARLLGLTQVDVQTAGQGGKVSLSYLGHAQAKQLREQILRSVARSRGEPPTAAAALPGAETGEPGAQMRPSPSVEPLTPVDPHAVAGGRAVPGETTAGAPGPAAAASASAGLPAVLDRRAQEFVDFDVDAEARETGSLITVPVGRLIASILLSWDIWIPVLLLVASIVSAILWEPFFLAMIVPAMLIAFGIGYSSLNRGFRFTLSRSSDGVRVGAGLTATNTETIPFGRIHAIEARQPLGWRPFGWWKVRVTTAGHGAASGGQNKMQNVVLPVGLESDVLRVFETLLAGPGMGEKPEATGAAPCSAVDAAGGSAADPEPGSVPGFAGLLHGLRGSRSEGGYLPAGPRAAWVLWFGVRRAGLRLADPDTEGATLRIRGGVLTRRFVVMPILRAQSVQLYRPLVHRFTGLASLQAHTVLGPVRVEMRGIGLDRARETFDELASAVVRVQAADAERIGAVRAALGGTANQAAQAAGQVRIASPDTARADAREIDEEQR